MWQIFVPGLNPEQIFADQQSFVLYVTNVILCRQKWSGLSLYANEFLVSVCITIRIVTGNINSADRYNFNHKQ